MDKSALFEQMRDCVLGGYEVKALQEMARELGDITLEKVDALFRQLEKKRSTHKGKLTPSLFRDKLKIINPNLAVESIMPMFSQKLELTSKDVYELLALEDLACTDKVLLESLELLQGDTGQIDFKRVNKLLSTLCMEEMTKEEFDNLRLFMGEDGSFSARTMFDTLAKIREVESKVEL
jgi:hypothetical protein